MESDLQYFMGVMSAVHVYMIITIYINTACIHVPASGYE